MNQIESLGVKVQSPSTGKPFYSPPSGSLFGVIMDMKVCSACKKDKLISEFSKDRSRKDGLCNTCKECIKLRHLKYRQADIERCRRWYHKNKERNRKRMREYAKAHREESAAYDAAYRKAYPEKVAAKIKKYALANPEKRKAKDAIHHAIRMGRLIRPGTCSECGDECRPHGHHYLGYEKEHWLDIEWLCITCHKKLHVELRRNEDD